MWLRILVGILIASVCSASWAAEDPATGFVMEEHWQLVASQCTVCHSARLVTQNRMNRTGWLSTIRWMQKKHNLWPLGVNEGPILDYLEKNYSVPENLLIRRKNLVIESSHRE